MILYLLKLFCQRTSLETSERRHFLKIYVLPWLNLFEKKIQNETISFSPFEYDHSCCFLNRRETLGSDTTVRFLLLFCREKHKTYKKAPCAKISLVGCRKFLLPCILEHTALLLRLSMDLRFSYQVLVKGFIRFLERVLPRTQLGYRAVP